MPSGKQILLSVLQERSQKLSEQKEIDSVNDQLRAALLLHCSTAEETWFIVEKIGWLSSTDKDGRVYRQGLGLKNGNIFLSDIVGAMMDDESIPQLVQNAFPNLSYEDFSDSLLIMWYIFSALQYWEELNGVENQGELDLAEKDRLIGSYIRKLHLHRADPQGYHGIVPEE